MVVLGNLGHPALRTPYAGPFGAIVMCPLNAMMVASIAMAGSHHVRWLIACAPVELPMLEQLGHETKKDAQSFR